MAQKPGPIVQVNLEEEIPALIFKHNAVMSYTWRKILELLTHEGITYELEEALEGITHAERANALKKVLNDNDLAFALTYDYTVRMAECGH